MSRTLLTSLLFAAFATTAPMAAQDDLHVFQASTARARLVRVVTGRVFGLVEGTAEVKGTKHHLELNGWLIDSRMRKTPMKIFGSKVPVSTMSRLHFTAKFVGEVDGACREGEVRVETLRQQWFKEPYLETFEKACEAIAAARKKGEDYIVDKELFKARSLRLGTAEQEIGLVLETKWKEREGPWIERWSVINRVGFDQKPLAEETQALELRVLPAVGNEAARLVAAASEDQMLKPFPSPAQPWGKELLKGFLSVDLELPTGFVVKPLDVGAEYELTGKWTATSRLAGKPRTGLKLVAPLPFAAATEPLLLAKEEAAFFAALGRWSLPAAFGR